jgi:uncharacterized protein YjiK
MSERKERNKIAAAKSRANRKRTYEVMQKTIEQLTEEKIALEKENLFLKSQLSLQRPVNADCNDVSLLTWNPDVAFLCEVVESLDHPCDEQLMEAFFSTEQAVPPSCP